MHFIAKAGVSTALALVMTAAAGGVSFASTKSSAQQYQAIATAIDSDGNQTTPNKLEQDAAKFETELLAIPTSGQAHSDLRATVADFKTWIADLEAATKKKATQATKAKVQPATNALVSDVAAIRKDFGLKANKNGF
jgi:dihydropteroate synthase